MKKIFTLALLATLALVGCSKVNPENNDDNGMSAQKEVSFQVANYAGQTKADNNHENHSAYSTSIAFGTYAWFNGTDSFMSNQKISYQTSVWKAEGQTYYWPKTGSIDFISYSPYSATPWLTVNKTQLTASTTGVAANADYLYSDKALEFTENGNGIHYTSGVPTLFHHALCQVCVKIKAEKLHNTANDVQWEIKLLAADAEKGIAAPAINDYAKTGSLTMNLNASGAAGTARENGWTLPTNAVWAVEAANFNQTLACAAQTLPYTLTTSAADILALTTVMPQALGTQTLDFSISIKTTTTAGTSITETYPVSIDLKTKMGNSAPAYWQMNKKITYTVTINPEGNEILFDPAVVDWETESGSNTVQL